MTRIWTALLLGLVVIGNAANVAAQELKPAVPDAAEATGHIAQNFRLYSSLKLRPISGARSLIRDR